MKTYENMAQDALKRIENHENAKTKRIGMLKKAAVPAACFCLAVLFGIGVRETGVYNNRTQYTVPADNSGYVSDSEKQEKVSEQVNAADTVNTEIPADAPDAQTEITGDVEGYGETMDCCRFLWKNKVVYGSLYQALNDASGEALTVKAEYRPTTSEITSFSYEGKTLSEIAILAEEERLTSDSTAARKTYQRAFSAYMDTVLPSVEAALSDAGIRCERASDGSKTIILTVTAEELEKLSLDDMTHWYFDLASDRQQ